MKTFVVICGRSDRMNFAYEFQTAIYADTKLVKGTDYSVKSEGRFRVTTTFTPLTAQAEVEMEKIRNEQFRHDVKRV